MIIITLSDTTNQSELHKLKRTQMREWFSSQNENLCDVTFTMYEDGEEKKIHVHELFLNQCPKLLNIVQKVKSTNKDFKDHVSVNIQQYYKDVDYNTFYIFLVCTFLACANVK